MTRPLATFAAVILAGALLVVAAILATSSPAAPPCRAGASSVGPVVLRDGRLVAAETTPHTEACLP